MTCVLKDLKSDFFVLFLNIDKAIHTVEYSKLEYEFRIRPNVFKMRDLIKVLSYASLNSKKSTS